MPDQPTVWIVSAEQSTRALIRAELIERGCDVEGFVSLEHAISALDRPLFARPEVVVLDLSVQVARDADLDRIAATAVPIVLLGGAMELGGLPVGVDRWVGVMRRPFAIGDVAGKVMELLTKFSCR